MTGTISSNASIDAAPGRTAPVPWLLRQTHLGSAVRLPGPGAGNRPPGGDEPLLAVRVLDNAVNTYEQVMEVCCRALGVSLEQAYRMAHTIDHEGSCVVRVAPRDEAERVAEIIRAIGIEVRLEASPP